MRLRGIHLFVPMLAGWLVVIGLLGGTFARSATANHGARITIHHNLCSSDAEDMYGECHNRPMLGSYAFYVAGVWRETVGNQGTYGVVSWTPGAGTHVIAQDEVTFSYSEGAYVYCSNQMTGEVLWDGRIDDQPAITITTTAGQEVVCDWYNLDFDPY